MSRQKIIAGNWKMNTSLAESILLTKNLLENFNHHSPQMVLIPPFTHLTTIYHLLKGSVIKLGAQNCHQEPKGAYTGEISAPMLASLDIDYVVVGHSERRQYFDETNNILSLKVNLALANNLIPIFCVGEALEIRQSNGQNDFVNKQLMEGLFHLSPELFSKVVIAYEPIWAIGTGMTATPEQAQDMHAFIRSEINKKYGTVMANKITILYGGSVKGSNAKEIFSQNDVDGALVGGASLDAIDFLKIASSF